MTDIPVVNFITLGFSHLLSCPTILEESKIDTFHCGDGLILLVCEMICLSLLCAFVKYVSALESFRMKDVLERQGKAIM